jgi:hypothetical protein
MSEAAEQQLQLAKHVADCKPKLDEYKSHTLCQHLGDLPAGHDAMQSSASLRMCIAVEPGGHVTLTCFPS